MFKQYFWETPGFFFFAFVAAICGVFALIPFFGSLTCDDIGDATGRHVEYRILSGCYVQVNGRMVPAGSWRGEQDR